MSLNTILPSLILGGSGGVSTNNIWMRSAFFVSSSSGSQDLTISGMGTPKGVIFRMVKVSAVDTIVGNTAISQGYYDGTSSWADGFKGTNNTSSSTFASARVSTASGVMVRINESSANNSLVETITASALITDGVTISRSDTATLVIECIFIGGDDVTVDVGNFTGAAIDNTVTVTPGIAADILFTSSSYSVSLDSVSGITGVFATAMSSWNGSTYDTVGTNFRQDGVTAGRGMIDDSRLPFGDRFMTFQNQTSTQFDALTTLGNLATLRVGYLAVELASGSAVVDVVDTSSSTGLVAFDHGASGTLQSALVIGTHCAAVDTYYDNGTGSAMLWGFVNASETHSVRIAFEDGSNPTDTESEAQTNFDLPLDDGGAAYVGTSANWASSGFDINFTAVRGVVDKWGVLYLLND